MKGLLTVTVAALLVAALVVPAPRERVQPATHGADIPVGRGVDAEQDTVGLSLGASVVVVPGGSKSPDRHPLARYETGSASGAPHSLGPRSRPAAAADPRHKPATAPVASKAPERVYVATPPSAVLSGTSSWYCLSGRSACTRGYSDGCLCAAAGPAVRAALGEWRGKWVTVRTARAGVRVQLVDWCQCYGTRLIDLYSYPFSMLAPLSAGVMDVTVEVQ